MKYEFIPKGVCSRKMIFEVENGVVKNVEVLGGCNGNGKGMSALVEGMTVDEVIKRLKDIKCDNRSSSCPAQFAKALLEKVES